MKRILVVFCLFVLSISIFTGSPQTLLAEEALTSFDSPAEATQETEQLAKQSSETNPNQEQLEQNSQSESVQEPTTESSDQENVTKETGDSLEKIEQNQVEAVSDIENNQVSDINSNTSETSTTTEELLPNSNENPQNAAVETLEINANNTSTSTDSDIETATSSPQSTSSTPNGLSLMNIMSDSPAPHECSICEKDIEENPVEIVVDENVTADFNGDTPTCSGDPDLCQFFTFEKLGATANTWNAIFDLGAKRLIVKNGASIKTAQIPTSGNSRYAPGIIIKTSCSILMEEDALIEVVSLNRLAGDILIKGGDDVIINGSILNTVGGTMQAPGQITVASCCSNIITGPKSRIMVNGVDHGGRNIDILAHNNIELRGIIESNYRSGATSTINVISFDGAVLVDGTNRFPDEIENTHIPRTSGIFVRSKRDPLPGQINIRAKKDIAVLGNTVINKRHANPGAVAVKSASNGSKSGIIDVRSLEGGITASDRAFDNANRFGTKGSITLLAKNDIVLSVTDSKNDGASTNQKIVVNSEAADVRTLGGNNIIRSYSSKIQIGEHAEVSTENQGGIDGKNILTSCQGITNNGIVHFQDLNTGDDTGVCDPSLPPANEDTAQKILFAKISSYAHGALQCLISEPQNQAPVIIILGANPFTITQGDTFTDPGATAFDVEDGNITANIVVGGNVVTPTTAPGTYGITYNVKDSQGLPAPETMRVVLVVPPKPQCSDTMDNDHDGLTDSADPACHTDGDPDNEDSYNPDINDENMPPAIKLIGLNPLEIEEGVVFTDPGATAFDQEDGNITPNIVLGGDKITSTTTPGMYHLTYNVKDSKGVAALEVIRTVLVKELVPPPPKPQCSDNVDNDGDGHIDADDPACHTDEDPDNTSSYNPNIDDENSIPRISILGNNPFFVVFGGIFIDPGATAFDQEDGNITPNIVLGGDRITSTTTPGTYMVKYDVQDSKGATAVQVSRTVTVQAEPGSHQCSDNVDNDGDGHIDAADPACHTDNDPNNNSSYDPADNDENAAPTITVVGNNPYEIRTGDAFSDPGAIAFDQEDGNITPNIVVGGDKITSTTTPGTYHIIYNVKDSKEVAAPEAQRTVSILSGSNPPSGGGGGGSSSTSGGGGGSSGSGGGGIIAQTAIAITNEQAIAVSGTSALITWTTNIPGSSMVVYGTSSRALADGSLPHFGYTHSTDKYTALVKDHSIIVNDLTPNTTYYFRPVSEEWLSKAIGKEVTISETPKECNYLLEYLKYGANNNPIEVRKLQVFLRNFEGFTNLEVTGVFDIPTFNAVSAFQQKYFDLVLAPWGHDKPTGYVYITTKKRVNEIYCTYEFALTDAQKQEIQAFKIYLESLKKTATAGQTGSQSSLTPQRESRPDSTITPPDRATTTTSTKPEIIDIPPINLDETPVGLEDETEATPGRFQNMLASVFSIPASSAEAAQCTIAFLFILALVILAELIWRKPSHQTSNKLFFWVIGTFIAIPIAILLRFGCIVIPLAAVLAVLIILHIINRREEAR